MALGQCRECGKEVSDSAKVCPNCGIKTPIRKSVTLIQAVIIIFIGAWIISKMAGMLGVEHTASTTVEHTASTTTASVTPKVSLISVDSIYVNGKEIQIGDTADQVFKLLTKDQMVSQTEEKDPNNALSLLVIKHIQVNGKKFAVYFSRVQDPGPYKVTKIIENTASVTSKNTSDAQRSASPGSHIVTGNNQYGCTDKGYYSKLIGLVADQDKAAFEQELSTGIATGQCTVFHTGEEVFLSGTAILSGVVKLRRKGETSEYWTAMETIK